MPQVETDDGRGNGQQPATSVVDTAPSGNTRNLQDQQAQQGPQSGHVYPGPYNILNVNPSANVAGGGSVLAVPSQYAAVSGTANVHGLPQQAIMYQSPPFLPGMVPYHPQQIWPPGVPLSSQVPLPLAPQQGLPFPQMPGVVYGGQPIALPYGVAFQGGGNTANAPPVNATPSRPPSIQRSSNSHGRTPYIKPALLQSALDSHSATQDGGSDASYPPYTPSVSTGLGSNPSFNGGPDRPSRPNNPSRPATQGPSRKQLQEARREASSELRLQLATNGVIFLCPPNAEILRAELKSALERARQKFSLNIPALVPDWNDEDRHIESLIVPERLRMKTAGRLIIPRIEFQHLTKSGVPRHKAAAFRAWSLTLVEEEFPLFIKYIVDKFNINLSKDFKPNAMAFVDSPNVIKNGQPLSPIPFNSIAVREIFVDYLYGHPDAIGCTNPEKITMECMRKVLSAVLTVTLNCYDERRTGKPTLLPLDPAIYYHYQDRFRKIIDETSDVDEVNMSLTQTLQLWQRYGEALYGIGADVVTEIPARGQNGQVEKHFGADARPTFSTNEIMAEAKAEKFLRTIPEVAPIVPLSDLTTSHSFMTNFAPEIQGMDLPAPGAEASWAL